MCCSRRSFISRYATIRIRLRNCGNEAFKYSQYGPSIWVERRLSKTPGGGYYKLKSHNGDCAPMSNLSLLLTVLAGRVVSTQKKELQRILEHFNIHVQNPCVVLNQDTARQFLTTTDPKKKYEVFRCVKCGVA